MADVTVRRGGGGGSAMAEFDPLRMVRESMRRMNELFREPLAGIDPLLALEGRFNQYNPPFEVVETQDGLLFRADLPGVRFEDIDVTVAGNRLRVSGRRELEEQFREDTWYTAERSYGTFSRTFILPDGVDTDKVCANLENGVLSIEVAKRASAQPRRIEVGQQRTVEGTAEPGGQYAGGTSVPTSAPGAGSWNQAEGSQAGGEKQPSYPGAAGSQQQGFTGSQQGYPGSRQQGSQQRQGYPEQPGAQASGGQSSGLPGWDRPEVQGSPQPGLQGEQPNVTEPEKEKV